MIDLLQDLIRIPSDTKEGANKALDFSAHWLEEQGVKVTVLENQGYKMLVAEIGQGDETLIWNGHLDIVPGKPEQYVPYIEGDKIFGRGSADMKGGCAAMMAAFAGICKHPDRLTKKVQLHLVTDEETGGSKTSKYLVQQGYTGDFVICGEPTFLKIGLQAKGISQFFITFHGKGAHGSRPWEGDNAILQSHLFHQLLLEQEWTKESTQYYEHPSINLARIQAGDRFNMVPDTCEVGYDIRFVPGQSVEFVEQQLQSILDEHFPNAELRRRGISPAVTTSDKDPRILQLLDILKEETEIMGQHGSADTRHYAVTGAGAIEFGPAGGDWHGPGEFVSIASMERYRDILMEFAFYTGVPEVEEV